MGNSQLPVAPETASSLDGGVLSTDESLIGESVDVLADRVGTHPRCRTDGSVARPALMSAAIFTSAEIRVHRELTGGETEGEYLIGRGEIVLRHCVPP